MTLSSKERKYLRGLAHSLKPIIQIGQKGLTEGLVEAVKEALHTHELIKVKFIDCKDLKNEISAEIAELTDAELCGTIGNISIFYKESSDEKKRKISLKNISDED